MAGPDASPRCHAVTTVLASGGRVARFGSDQHAAATAVMANPDPATLDRLAVDAAAGRLRVPITRTYDLAEVPQAITDFSAGKLGKLAVSLP